MPPVALDVDFDVLEGPISQFSPGSYLSINRYFRIAAPFTGTKTETLSFGTLGNDYMSLVVELKFVPITVQELRRLEHCLEHLNL